MLNFEIDGFGVFDNAKYVYVVNVVSRLMNS